MITKKHAFTDFSDTRNKYFVASSVGGIVLNGDGGFQVSPRAFVLAPSPASL